MRTKLFLCLLLILHSGLQLTAAELKTSELVQITSPVAGDLYLAGEKVVVAAPVSGDVVAGSGSIEITDSVKGDALLAGGTIDISGFVADDIRAFGGTLNLYNGCGGDLLIFGGTITLHRDARIMGDVIVFGGQLKINGIINGNLKAYGGSVTLNGKVNGAADVKGGELYINGTISGPASLALSEITLGDEALLEGDVRYWTEDGEMDFGAAATNARYDASLGKDFEENDWSGPGIFGFLLFSLLASLLLSLLLVFVFGRYFSRGAQKFNNEFFKSFGFGVLYVIGVPVVIFILMIIVIGIPLGLLTLAFFIFTLVFAPAFAAVIITYWLANRYHKNWNKGLIWLISGGIFLVICLLLMIPFVGWLLGSILVGAALGAIILGAFQKRAIPVV